MIIKISMEMAKMLAAMLDPEFNEGIQNSELWQEANRLHSELNNGMRDREALDKLLRFYGSGKDA